MDTTTPKAIDPAELAELVEINGRRSVLFGDLGGITHQQHVLEAQANEIHAKLGQVDRDYMMLSQRLMRKYGFAEGTNVNLTTGVYGQKE